MGERDRKKGGISVSIPGCDLDDVLGPRRDGRTAAAVKSKLEKKKEKLEELDVDSELLETEAEIAQKKMELADRAAGRVPPPPETVGDKLLDQVLIPMVNKKLQEDEEGKESVAIRALSLAEATIKKRTEEPGRESIGAMITDVVKAIDSIKSLRGVDDETKQRLERIESKLQKDSTAEEQLTAIDQLFDLEDKIKERISHGRHEGVKGEFSLDEARFISDERRKDREFQRRTSLEDRAFRLALRKQDKGFDVELAKLSVAKERTNVLKNAIKSIGGAVADALEEEEGEVMGLSEGKQVVTLSCPNEGCGATISVPPEAQTPGTKIKCPKCKSTLEWTEE